MSIKSFFNDLAEKREEKRKYKALAAAINARDIDGVNAALKSGANAGHLSGTKYDQMPMTLALKSGMPEIVEALLNTKEGLATTRDWFIERRILAQDKDSPKETVYFTPTYLYSAIDAGQEKIALLFAKHKWVDPDYSGNIYGGRGDHWLQREEFPDLVKSPVVLAREKGMTAVADALQERMSPPTEKPKAPPPTARLRV